MKTILPFVVVILFALGACTEEIIKIEKQTDTLVVQKFVDRYFSGTDTVEIPVVVEIPTPTRNQSDTVFVRDTVWMQRVDTLWRTQTIVEHDTVVIREQTFGDTLFITYGRGTQSVPFELFDMWLEFFNQAGSHGHQTYTGTMIVERVKMDAVQQAYSFVAYGQLFIKLNSNLTDDESMLPLWRELARQRLGKEYSQVPTSTLYPFFPANVIRWSNRDQHQIELNELF